MTQLSNNAPKTSLHKREYLSLFQMMTRAKMKPPNNHLATRTITILRLQRLHRAQRRATDRTNCTVQVCLMISAQLFPPQHFGPFLAIWLSGRLDVFFLEDLKHLLH
ncbi:hypothetical protein PC119_g21380 [Phytophthora cactorum]|uniref:Uncharacterized protein n=1 Tax=Phytophthora cactorum TaxID=29920 RepID=A0A8T0Y4L3_9STRA|nr:hypothetical protein PC111_g22350 [Phytophthora cactorum]KAG2812054.1 hypothetical protein PC112_g15347 [Phytophthora cactorum]KAG2837690.1 hypothetical protein PC113_g19791 [Phytophthora cactorum]KAG2882503.1 hypothetical protein PC114_g21001 [Phytophthora cactorum]KAG2979801.1 hypothetical protein PC119_g21380 [Phytophthora cactorum]